MKLLFDENLSHKLVGILAHECPGCAHVRDIGLRASEDGQMWDFVTSGATAGRRTSPASAVSTASSTRAIGHTSALSQTVAPRLACAKHP